MCMKVKIEGIYKGDFSTEKPLPYFEAKVPAGFPSPAADYEENQLDLNKHLIRNPAATFFVRVSGDSMTGAGINDGDLLIVDRSLEPKNKNVVIAVINGEMVATAGWLDKNTGPEDLIAAHDIGAIGYFSERDLLDLAGLISPDVIPFIRDEARLASYLDEKCPDYLVTFPDWYPSLVKDREIRHGNTT